MEQISIEDALDMLYNGDLYDEKGNVTSEGYKALATLDGVVLTERKRGKWNGNRCSECKKICTDNIRGYYEILHKPKYCPHCGVEMEEQTNERGER